MGPFIRLSLPIRPFQGTLYIAIGPFSPAPGRGGGGVQGGLRTALALSENVVKWFCAEDDDFLVLSMHISDLFLVCLLVLILFVLLYVRFFLAVTLVLVFSPFLLRLCPSTAFPAISHDVTLC